VSTNRRRRRPERRPDLVELSIDQKHHLLDGWYFFDPLTREDFELAWEMHGEALLAEYVKQHAGRRPFAWWLIDHGEERPIVNPKWTREAALKFQTGHEAKFGFLHTHTWPAIQEDETAYLHRFGLLEAEERAVLALT
jgi:hypothetical protein